MLEQLPHLFDRKFLVGYFLPATLFLGFSLALLSPLPGIQHIIIAFMADLTLGLLYSVIFGLVIAYHLVAINRPLIVLLEGYHFPFGSIKWLTSRQINRRRHIQDCISRLSDSEKHLIDFQRNRPEKFTDSQRRILTDLQIKRGMKLQKLINNFPDMEAYVLPTRFGNVMRAFEVYPRIMYGIDSIPGWYRLTRVMEKSGDEQTSSDKILVDYYVNLCILSFVVLPMIIIRSLYDLHALKGADWVQVAVNEWWLPVAFLGTLGLGWVFYNGAIAAAVGWGAQVKADFDVYIHDLARKLGYSPPLSKDLWGQISQAFIYLSPLPPTKVADDTTEINDDAVTAYLRHKSDSTVD